MSEIKLKGVDDLDPNYTIPGVAEEGEMTKGSIPPSIETKYLSHQAVILSRLQSNDTYTVPFDFQERGEDISSGVSRYSVLSVTFRKGIEGVLAKYGWYTDADGAPYIQFGLFVNGELYAPGGKYIENSTMDTVENFEPSGSSIAFRDLAEPNIFVPENTTIEIRVSNTDTKTHQVWCRVFGKHWPKQSISAYRTAYWDKKTKRIL